MLGKKYEVLVLDDEEQILNSFKRLYQDEDFNIITTTDSEKALDMIGKKKIKVVISDLLMPEVTGEEFLREVSHAYPHVARIALTAYADRSVSNDSWGECNVMRLIFKPWEYEDLKEAIIDGIKFYDSHQKA